MKIYMWGRRTGKTKKCEEFLKKNKDVCCLTYNKFVRNNYPISLRKRVFFYKIFKEGSFIKKIIIDEPDLMDTEILIRLIKQFEIIFMIGTPLYDSPNFSWLCKLCKINKKVLPEKLTRPFKKGISKAHYLSEFKCKFKGSL